jgi:acetyl esterase/lipase
MSSIDSAQNPTHQRFVRDLVVDSGFAAIFVNYTPSPEGHNPTSNNEAYAATTWVAEHGDEISRFKAFDPGI